MKKTLSYVVYWLWQCTWGFVMTSIGAMVALGLLIAGYKPKTLGPAVYFEVGEGWGGIELGGFFICCKDASLHTKSHELGHGLQNLIFGPFMPFVVCLPSAARYWLFYFDNPVKRALYVATLMITAILLTTGGACIFAIVGGFKAMVILFELIRMYFLLLVIWLNVWETPKFYSGKLPEYDEIWFERQASEWGKKLLK